MTGDETDFQRLCVFLAADDHSVTNSNSGFLHRWSARSSGWNESGAEFGNWLCLPAGGDRRGWNRSSKADGRRHEIRSEFIHLVCFYSMSISPNPFYFYIHVSFSIVSCHSLSIQKEVLTSRSH